MANPPRWALFGSGAILRIVTACGGVGRDIRGGGRHANSPRDNRG